MVRRLSTHPYYTIYLDQTNLMEYQDGNENGRTFISSKSIWEQQQLNDAKVA